MFSKPVHAVTARVGPPGPNHGPFTVKPSSHHVYVGLLGLGTYHPDFMVASVGTALIVQPVMLPLNRYVYTT